jgi:hypothetical protein
MLTMFVPHAEVLTGATSRANADRATTTVRGLTSTQLGMVGRSIRLRQ